MADIVLLFVLKGRDCMSKVLIEVLVIILITSSYLILYSAVRVSAISDQRIAEIRSRETFDKEKQLKTSNTCFNTSIKELAYALAFHDNVLDYNDRYFAVGEERLEVLDSKVENENLYLLTLVAMAKELEIRGKSETDVVLAVGLPLTRFSAERKPFIDYLSQNRKGYEPL